MACGCSSGFDAGSKSRDSRNTERSGSASIYSYTLRTSGEILIGRPTGYSRGNSVQRPITRKMIRRSILSMRSEKLIRRFRLFLPAAQVGPLHTENDLEG